MGHPVQTQTKRLYVLLCVLENLFDKNFDENLFFSLSWLQIPYNFHCMVNDDQGESSYQPELDELITLKEAAELSGLSYSHMRYLARESHIWAKKLGHNWFTTEAAVNEYLARDRRPGPKPKSDSSGSSE
jgi:hypothetical protein